MSIFLNFQYGENLFKILIFLLGGCSRFFRLLNSSDKQTKGGERKHEMSPLPQQEGHWRLYLNNAQHQAI
jgi:hypothetical protein